MEKNAKFEKKLDNFIEKIDKVLNSILSQNIVVVQREGVITKTSDLPILVPERHIEANIDLNYKISTEKSKTCYYPKSNVTRAHVPADKISWSINWPEYQPIEYTSESVLNNPNADNNLFAPQMEFNIVDEVHKIDRSSLEKYDVVKGLPVNPNGRTGITGRGSLNFWGPNHAVEAIITRLVFKVRNIKRLSLTSIRDSFMSF